MSAGTCTGESRYMHWGAQAQALVSTGEGIGEYTTGTGIGESMQALGSTLQMQALVSTGEGIGEYTTGTGIVE